jgi:hypothetical protein
LICKKRQEFLLNLHFAATCDLVARRKVIDLVLPSQILPCRLGRQKEALALLEQPKA